MRNFILKINHALAAKTKLFSLFLALATSTSALVAANVVESGTCGAAGNEANVIWTLTDDGVLTISGTGNMANFAQYSLAGSAPWYSSRASINKIIVTNGIENLGTYITCDYSNVTDVEIGEDVVIANDNSFYQPNQSSINLIWNAKRCETNPFNWAKVQKITFGNKVEYIPDLNLTSTVNEISIPNSVVEIANHAFNGCNISKLNIPNNVKIVGSFAFANCTQLTEATIGEGVEEFGAGTTGYGVLSGCTQLKTIVWNAIKCNTMSRNAGLTSLTDMILGSKVEIIPENFCYNYTALKTISLPNSIKEIGAGAFYQCSSLKEVALPTSLTYIGTYAFKESGINTLSLPNNSLTIDAFAFADTKISEVTIPENTQTLAACAFDGCTSLRKINYNATNASVITITDRENYSNPVTYFASPFTGISNIVEVIVGANVQSIPSYMFAQKCRRIYSSSYPEQWSTSTPAYKWSSGYDYPKFISKGLTTRFSKIKFEEGCQLQRIGEGAFAYCTELTNLILPESVQYIETCAFIGCERLTEMKIPENAKGIRESALYGCSSLKKLVIPSYTKVYTEGYKYSNTSIAKQNNYLYDWAQNLDSVTAPANMFDFEEEHWSTAPKNITYLNVNAGTLTENAFAVINRNYKVLKTLDISNTGNTTLADEAFKGCYNLENLYLPNNLRYIGYMAVADCKHLQSIDIPASVEEIDDSAFENCRSLQTITFGGKQPAAISGKSFARKASNSNLRKIGNWAFYNAHELQHLEIPESVEEIGDAAFYGCVYLEDLVLPSSVRSIGDNCFALCSKLNKIVVDATTPPTIQAKTFYDVKRQIPVYVPDDCVEAYEDNLYWSEFNIQGRSNMPTAIDQVTNDQSPVTNKILRDGQIFILRGEKIYTIQGQKVK